MRDVILYILVIGAGTGGELSVDWFCLVVQPISLSVNAISNRVAGVL